MRRILKARGRALIAASILGLPLLWAAFSWIVHAPALTPVALGRASYDRGLYTEAETQARRALTIKKDDPDALRLLARASARQRKDDTARRLYQRLGAETMEPEDHYLVAMTLVREGRPKDAREALQIVLQDQPEHAEARAELARIALDEGRPAEAETMSEPLLRRPGWEVRGGVLLGIARDLAADPAGAASPLIQALDRDPSLEGTGKTPAEIRKRLARVLLKLHRPDEARDQLNKVLAGGADTEAQWLLSRAAIQTGDATAADAALALAGSYASDHPERFEPAPFVGSARCAECHKAIHHDQQSSRHSRTFRRPSDWTETAAPAHPIADPSDPKASHALEKSARGWTMTTRMGDATHGALVDYVLGSGDRGVTFVGRDDKGTPRELRLSHFGKADAWDVTAGHPKIPQNPRDWLGLAQSSDALRSCLGCHTTNPRAILDGTAAPESKDHAIGCERCHGPGGNHVDSLAISFADPAIGRPRLATSEAVTKLCGQCHGVGNRPVPKDDPIALLRFQASTLPMSRCYSQSQGALSCLTCHDPHRNAETSAAFYESKCLSCHGVAPSSTVSPEARESHLSAVLPEGVRRVPCPVDPARGCLSCHMPDRESQMPHSRFTDHDIRIYRPRVSKSPSP